jgi:hypothetical protein
MVQKYKKALQLSEASSLSNWYLKTLSMLQAIHCTILKQTNGLMLHREIITVFVRESYET